MPQTCTICLHPDRDAINARLIKAEPLRKIAKAFSLGESSLYRHRRYCISDLLVKATQAAEVVKADNLLESIRDLHARTLGILRDAEANGERLTALKAIREARSNIELMARLLGELEAATPGNTTVQIVYVDQTIGGSMTDAPKLIEAQKSYLNAPVTNTSIAVEKA